MMMNTTQAAVISDHTLASGEAREVIRSRFGDIVIDTRKGLQFPKGLLGLPLAQHFALANFPSEKMQQFKLLQCLDDTALSFISLPLALDNALLQRADILAVCDELGIRQEDLALLLIVCVHRMADTTRLSVNVRAPIMIDAQRKLGVQHVFMQDYYKVQHFIN